MAASAVEGAVWAYLCAQRERNGPWVDRSGGWENEGVAKGAASWPGRGCFTGSTALIWAGSRDQVRLGQILGDVETEGGGCGRLSGRGQGQVGGVSQDKNPRSEGV